MRRPATLIGAGLMLVGCSSTGPRYYTLETAPGQPVRVTRQVVVVRRLPIPRYLDRNEIVVKSDAGRVHVSDEDWWSETLRTMMPRVLAADLAQRLPAAEVLGTESLGTGALGGESVTVLLSVDRFEPRGDGVVMLDGHLAIQVGGRDRLLRRIGIEVFPTGLGTEAQIRAMSLAVGQVADITASALASHSP